MPSLSANNFAKNVPTKSSNSFSNNDPSVSSNSFSDISMPKNSDVFEGENITGTAFGGPDAIFGDQYGQGNFGGFAHFKNRSATPDIDHSA